MPQLDSVPTNNDIRSQLHIAKKEDLGDLASLMVHKEDVQLRSFPFHSTGMGTALGSINLGGHKSIEARPRNLGYELTYHTGDTKEEPMGGLNATKFGKGFQRRMEGDIR